MNKKRATELAEKVIKLSSSGNSTSMEVLSVFGLLVEETGGFKRAVMALNQRSKGKDKKFEGVINFLMTDLELWTIVTMSRECALPALEVLREREATISAETAQKMLDNLRLAEPEARDGLRRLCARVRIRQRQAVA